MRVMVTLLVAASGGHLKELHALRPRFIPPCGETVWVTYATVQSRSLLAGEECVFVPPQDSHNAVYTVRNAFLGVGVLRRFRPRMVISTGSGIALSFLPLAKALGASCHYIESATRVQGPSLTGRLLRHVPYVHRYTQHQSWSGPHWRYEGSLLEVFEAKTQSGSPNPIRRVVVALGSWRQSFRSLVDRLFRVLPADVETLWQTGFTEVSDLPIEPRPWVPPRELAAAMRQADLVVSHAGMGVTLDALEAGKCPLVVPRRRALGEQVDNHQVELAEKLDALGLAIARLPEDITFEDLVAAAERRVEQLERPPPFQLHEYPKMGTLGAR